jgi:nicotinamidase-related amidase
MTEHPWFDRLVEIMPVELASYPLGARPVGLVVIDEVNGFCTVGAGQLAPPRADDQISRMVDESDRLARRFADAGWPILAFLDTHEPGKLEPPYPPHCERGTGEENLVPELAWLDGCPSAKLIRKDCINGFVGSIEPSFHGRHGEHHNKLVDWINVNRLEAIVVVGICTDICVLDFVVTLLSVRNHGLVPTLQDVVVYEPGCATYDLPRDAAESLGLPSTAAHPKAATHHMGLYVMAARGAVLANRLA